MAHLFRDLSLGHSKRDSTPPPTIMPPKSAITAVADDLPSPLGQLAANLSDSDLSLTAYEIFVAACRTSSGKPLSSAVPSHASSNSPSQNSPNSPALQRSITSTAASKMKKAFGLKSPGSGSRKSPGSGSGSGSGQGKPKKPLTVGELMRNQMRVSEAMDSRVRRALLRISAGQVLNTTIPSRFLHVLQCMYIATLDLASQTLFSFQFYLFISFYCFVTILDIARNCTEIKPMHCEKLQLRRVQVQNPRCCG